MESKKSSARSGSLQFIQRPGDYREKQIDRVTKGNSRIAALGLTINVEYQEL